MKDIKIEAQLRANLGKSAANKIRSTDNVLGVVYGGKNTIHFYAPATSFKNLVYTPNFHVVNLVINNQSYKCVLKDLQFDKVTDKLLHVDLLEVNEEKPITITLPLNFVGTPEGVKQGGRLITKLKSLKVKTLPKYVQEKITINLEKLELNKNIRVEDVKVDNYTILNSARIPIATVVSTRQLKQEENKAAATPAAAKPAAPAAEAKKEEPKKK